MDTTRNLLTPGEAADVCRLTSHRITKLAKAGCIPVVILPGGELRFDEADLWAWIAKHKRPAKPEGAPAR